jgi:tRNA (cytidine32/uridine32-2'-O)-methyltransferase
MQSMMSLDRIRVVLVATSHAGNIGGCARAMKTMGLTRLVLVDPLRFPDPEATARAVGAEDILINATVCASLDEALADCQLVIGTSARNRRIPWPVLAPEAAAELMVSEATDREVAVLFGRERTGLTNEELDRCQWLVNIPTASAFSSLNLASAVQIISYEIRRAVWRGDATPRTAEDMLGEPLASAEEVQRYYEHLQQVLVETGFLDPDNPRLLMRRLMRLYNRIQLTTNEVNILRGILAAVTQPHHKKPRN